MNNLLHAARPVLIDSLSVILFALLIALKVDVVLAAGLSVALVASQIVWRIRRKEPVGALQWLSLVVVLISGGATILTHDPRFLMIKPTVVYVAIGAVMLQRGWMLRYAPPIAGRSVDDLFIAFGYVWAGLMFLTAGINLVVAWKFAAAWPVFIAVFPLASKLALFLVHFSTVNVIARRRMRAASMTKGAAVAL